jgi:nitroreductase
MDNTFTIISDIIKSRRSIKPFMMNGKKATDDQVESLLQLADWTPTHGYTEPWRFQVYSNPPEFCRQHAELYKQHTSPENFTESVYNNLLHQGDSASHVILASMKRGDLPKIPVIEEMEAAACAVQNILLGATALGMASFWSTGGMALRPPMKNFLNLAEDDHVVGVIYLGYVDEIPPGRRTIPLKEKITWIK